LKVNWFVKAAKNGPKRLKKCIGESGEVGDIVNIVNIAMQKFAWQS